MIADYLMISWIPGTGELTVLCASLLGEAWYSFGIMLILRKYSWETQGHWLLVAWLELLL